MLIGLSFICISNMKYEKKIHISILPVGQVDREKINFIRKTLVDFYDGDVVVLSEIPNTKLCKLKNTNKYDAGCMLSNFNYLRVPKNGKILIVTNQNISTQRTLNGVTHKNWSIFGLGRINGKMCIVSTYKIKTRSKLAKVSIHEIGHTLGIPHCENNNCVMTDAKGKGSRIDKNSGKMCLKCNQIIKKRFLPHH